MNKLLTEKQLNAIVENLKHLMDVTKLRNEGEDRQFWRGYNVGTISTLVMIINTLQQLEPSNEA